MKNTEAAGEKTIEDNRCVKRGFTGINLLRRFGKRAGEKTHGSSCKMTQLSLKRGPKKGSKAASSVQKLTHQDCKPGSRP